MVVVVGDRLPLPGVLAVQILSLLQLFLPAEAVVAQKAALMVMMAAPVVGLDTIEPFLV